jgi:hypothetical protein
MNLEMGSINAPGQRPACLRRGRAGTEPRLDDRNNAGRKPLPFVSERFEQEGEGRGLLSSAWIIEVIARVWRAPIFKHTDQTSVGNKLGNLALERVNQPQSAERCVYQHLVVVDDQRSVDPDVKLDTIALELPGIEPSARTLPVADATVVAQITRRLRPARRRGYRRRTGPRRYL